MHAKRKEVYESDKLQNVLLSIIMMYITSPLFKTRINRVAVKANNTEKEKRTVMTILKERKYVWKKEKKNGRKYWPMRKKTLTTNLITCIIIFAETK